MNPDSTNVLPMENLAAVQSSSANILEDRMTTLNTDYRRNRSVNIDKLVMRRKSGPYLYVSFSSSL